MPSFPTYPTIGEIFTFGQYSWQWTGTYWQPYVSSSTSFTAITSVGNGYSIINNTTGTTLELRSFSGINITIITGTSGTLTFSASTGGGGGGGSGSSGTSGLSFGSSGTSGINGSSGTSGNSGSSGTSGNSGSSGTSGENGSSGTSGNSGSSGTSGENGSSGTSGENGTSGNSGSSGTSGENGSSGTSGTSPDISGTINYIPKFTGATSLGNSLIYDDGTNLGIGTTSPSAKLDINVSTGGTIGVRISGDSSSDMLRITQTGSGNAILVEDSSNPDSTPFVVTSGGTVGIGTTTPSYFLEAISTGGVDAVMMFDGGTAANSNLVSRADTTQKLPVIVMSDRNNAYSILTSFYIALDRASGASWSTLFTSRNDAIYVNNYTDKGHHFVTTNSGGTKAVRMSIIGSGNVGIGTTSPSANLDVISPTSGSTPILRVSGASSVEAVRITQTGGGFALVVEDSTNPDSNSFVVDSAGRVGVGYGTGDTLGQAFTVNGSGVASTSFIAATLQGTTLYPQNDVNLNIRTRDGGAGNRDILFGTGNSGGVPFTRMTIASTGNVGIGTTSPSSNLHVTGNTLIGGTLTATTISATTYQNLPVSGLTEGSGIGITNNNNNFTISYTGSTGGLTFQQVQMVAFLSS